MHTKRWLLLITTAITAGAAGCGATDQRETQRRHPSNGSTGTSGAPTASRGDTPAPAIECRVDFDCCANPNIPCGRACANGACVDVDSGIDLSVAASWRTNDLRALPDGTPVLVRTVLDGFTTTDLPATLRGFVTNPITSDARDPYLLLETDPTDGRWNLMLGPVAGMSGSPIIIDGRLAGALSFSVDDTIAPFLFVATPIEKMLAVDATSLEDRATSRAGGGAPLSAVLGVPSGAAEWLTGAGVFDDRFVTIPNDELGGVGSGTGNAPTLVPGSAIAVLLITGDILNTGGIGTVTAVDGDRVWAFGHPMMQSGPTALPFSAAEVMAVAANPTWGAYKIASPSGTALGAITDDRTAAIAGRFGPLPPMVTVRTDSTYLNAVQETHHQTALVGDAFGTAQFATFALVWPISVQRDHVSSGSVAYDITVTIGETELVGHRRDIVSTPFWMEQELFFDLFTRLGALVGDSRIPLTLERVEIVADVSDDRRELTINHIDAAHDVAPDSDLIVAVPLLPFGRSEPEQRALVLHVPADFPVGSALLEVGPEISIAQQDAGRPSASETPSTAEDIIAAFNALPRAQVLVARLTSLAAPPAPECRTCAEGTPCDPCTPPPPSDEPPPPPPSTRVSSEENAAVLGFETQTIEVGAVH